jgi:arsenate reductase (thioredoxin)
VTVPPGEPPRLLGLQETLAAIADRLAQRYSGTFTRATVERCVRESYQVLAATSKIPEIVPALADRFATDRLGALTRSQSLLAKPVPEVLFVCDRTAARSQMAAALLTLRAAGRVRVHSAGTRPAAELELHVVEAMGEIGADLSAEHPKPLTDEIVGAADIVVTVGCDDPCPVIPGRRYLDWTVPDPENQPMPEVRRIRDEIDLLVTDLLADLAPHTPAPTKDQLR